MERIGRQAKCHNIICWPLILPVSIKSIVVKTVPLQYSKTQCCHSYKYEVVKFIVCRELCVCIILSNIQKILYSFSGSHLKGKIVNSEKCVLFLV